MFKELNKKNTYIFNESIGDIELLKNTILKKEINVYTLEDIIADKELNSLGLQVYRWLIFEQMFEEKRKKTSLYSSVYHKQILENGFIKVENFMNQLHLEELENEISSIPIDVLKKKECFNLPLKMNISNHKMLQEIFKLCQADNSYFEDSLYLRKIVHMPPGDYCEDARQYNFHVDKFYPNYKLWLYPFNVSKKSGPLAFFKGSNVNTIKKMQWVHNRVINGQDWSRAHYNANDYKDTMKNMGFEEEIVCAAKKNTLFIVDTRMFHRRTPAALSKERICFRAILKRNNIFDGVEI